MAHFAETARDEVTLEVITRELASAIRESMQPDAVNVWLKK
jgi:hypothetical protein